jgi:manganese/iron transport system ATP-binding protein
MIKPSTIVVENVSVTYPNGHQALENVSFSLETSSICALVGVNGSGKSTLFKCLMDFVKPTAGHITIKGADIKTSQKNNVVAYVPQNEDVDWNFPILVWDVVMMGRFGHMNMFRIPKQNDKNKVLESLKKVGMDAFKDRQIGELSGGQKKRVFLARALAQEAQILLLDEPFTGVDISTEESIIELLKELRDTGHTIFVSTHDLGTIPTFCDHVVVINKHIIAVGPTKTAFNETTIRKAFGGALRTVHIDHTDSHEDESNIFNILSDDEDPIIFDQEGRPISPKRVKKDDK